MGRITAGSARRILAVSRLAQHLSVRVNNGRRARTIGRVRERDLDEFNSIFKRSIIPTIEVEKIEVSTILVLADFSATSQSCVDVAQALARRFAGARVCIRFLLHEGDVAHRAEAEQALDRWNADEKSILVGDPAGSIEGMFAGKPPSMVVAPTPFRRHDPTPTSDAAGAFVDQLLVATPVPTLLLRGKTDESIFQSILAKIPGGRHELIEQFSFAFALCPPGGKVRLLHVVEAERLNELAEILEVTPGIDTDEGSAELLHAIEMRMNHLLRGALRTGKDAAFEVVADLKVGDPFKIVPAAAADCSMIILGSATSHTEFLDSRAYQLMKALPGLPVLAL